VPPVPIVSVSHVELNEVSAAAAHLFDSSTLSLCVVLRATQTALIFKSSVFRDITPCGPLEVSRPFGGKYSLFYAGFLLDLPLVSKIEATCSSEMSVDFQWTIPEDRTLHNHRCENPRSCIALTSLLSLF
jgi:hypothetical protein